MATLPSPRHLVATLVSSISKADSSTATTVPTANPLKDASPETQKALLTLHVLFPNDLLPALDLLDRSLVTRFTLAHHPDLYDHHQQSETAEAVRRESAIYHVRSAQPPSRNRSALSHQHTTSYEVRLNSWSCSCPAFAFAAFPADSASSSPSSPPLPDHSFSGQDTADWTFGGLTRGNDMPVCKHLLACVLVERCQMFGSFAEEREVSVEELAGWAAGWGD